jgi:hypothetical protein
MIRSSVCRLTLRRKTRRGTPPSQEPGLKGKSCRFMKAGRDCYIFDIDGTIADVTSPVASHSEQAEGLG